VIVECDECIVSHYLFCAQVSQQLTPLVGESGKVDITRRVEEAGETYEEIGDILNERQGKLRRSGLLRTLTSFVTLNESVTRRPTSPFDVT